MTKMDPSMYETNEIHQRSPVNMQKSLIGDMGVGTENNMHICTCSKRAYPIKFGSETSIFID